jgi:hypothetical protein
MKQFFIEGVISKKGSRERVSIAVWAETPGEALKEARKQVGARQWVQGPELTLSEEQRMRAEGAPELFDYAAVVPQTTPVQQFDVKKHPGKSPAGKKS